jgi:hypothetical protein
MNKKNGRIALSDREVIDQVKETLQEAAAEQASPEAQASEGIIKETEPISKAPEPIATGNEQVAILKHDIYRKCKADGTEELGIEMTVKNQSDVTLGSVSFEALLYDIEGKVIDTIGRKELELSKDYNRMVRIISASSMADKAKSYAVRINKVVLTPPPTVTGNDSIVIFKHTLSISDLSSGVEFAIRNVSGVTAATLIFEAKFFDIEGNVLGTVKRNETDLKPGASRAVMILYPGQDSGYMIKSYAVYVIKMNTTNVEKVQLRRHEMKTNPAGEEEVDGVVKNISAMKTDAALVATFLNPQKENIGTLVLVLRDIEPDSIRRFQLKFKPQSGDTVRTYTVTIGDIAENLK